MKEHRIVGLFVVTIALLCIGGIAQAQTRVTACSPSTPNNAICLGPWTHDGKTVAGDAISGVTFRVEQKIGTGSFATIATGLANRQLYVQNLVPGTYTFRIFAACSAVGCIESDPSNESNRAATPIPIQPTAPVLIIAATIREGQPPTYRIVYTVTPRAGEIVFVAPADMRSTFAAR